MERTETATFDRLAPYNALPVLPPRVELETRAVLKKVISARAALAELKGAGKNIPDQSVLLTTLGLQEAKMSSEIENVVTTNDELYRAFADQNLEQSDAATKEVLRYNQALWHGHGQLPKRGLSTSLWEEIVAIIKQNDQGVRRLPGTQIANSATGDVIYTPPEGIDLLRDLLANLERFIYAEDDLDPLVKMAVMHYQFEAIHPFADGNGRTGRILNTLFLVEMNLLELPVLYMSRFIIERKGEYYALPQGVTEEQAWEPWLLFMLEAIADTASDTRRRISGIRDLIDRTTEHLKENASGIYSKDLGELLFQQPYCKIRFLEEAGIAKRQTASRYLQQLEELGLLRGYKLGREMYYLNIPFFDLLTKAEAPS